jgi:hypothetical protein
VGGIENMERSKSQDRGAQGNARRWIGGLNPAQARGID